MARRIDGDKDHDDGFEILDKTLPETFEFIENESFEIISDLNKSSPVTDTKPKLSVTFIEKSIPIPTESQSPPSSKQSSYLPTRYGSAAIIPYNDNSDLKSILGRKSNLPSSSSSSNDLINYLQNEKTKKKSPIHNQFQQILIDNAHEREHQLYIAKQMQQNFLNGVHLD